MSKVRVHELAKKLNISNKELQEKLTELNVEVKSHMSSINDEIVSKIEDLYGKKQQPKQEQKEQPKQEQKQQPKQEQQEQPKQEQQEVAQVKQEKTNKKGKKDDLIEEDDIKIIELGATCTVKELADALEQTSTEIITILFKQGIMATINQNIDFETAREIAESFDVICERAEEVNLLEQAFAEEDEEEDNEAHMQTRPPVVVVMGHVDHGKTSLLDSIKNTDIIGKEAGGITQHIGAYTVKIDGKAITFLDTPGHEAFTAMRMRGAQITDIAILVVAADDGVMPQTIEAINHAKAANLDIIVAINKIDKPGANPDRVKQELTEYGILVEDWGGDVISVPVSAKTGEGIETLLEMINLTAEMKELRANYKKRAKGTVIEGFLDKGRGAVANILVQNGTLRVGDPIVAGAAYGKIRAMIDDKGNKVKKATPSIPVEILGLSEVPKAGDLFYVAKNDKQARQIAESVKAKSREDMIKDTPQKVSLDDLFNQIQAGSVKELKIVIKADVQGSVEAVKSSLEKLSNAEVRIRTIHGGVGAITESDVTLAAASNAIIIGFNVRPDAKAKAMADAEKVDLRSYNVIYKAIEDISTAMHGMLDPIYEEKVIGTAEVRQLFKSSSVGTIAGSYVTSGKITKSAEVRIIREGVVVYTGTLDALKRFKDDAKEVAKGYECGLSFNGFNAVKEGDIVEAFVMEEIERKRLS